MSIGASILRSSRMAAVQGFSMYRSLCTYHYTKIIVVRACVRPYGREFTGSESTPAQKALFLCKTGDWRCNSWLTDTVSNCISSRLNHGF